MEKASFTLALAAVSCILVGCGGSGSGSGGPGTGGSNETVVTNNPTGTVPWSSVNGDSNLSNGVLIRINDTGTTVVETPATVISASVSDFTVSGHSETGVEALYCQINNGRGVFQGDSGSPVLINGNIAGGLFGSSDNVHFYARGIEQEEVTSQGPPIRQVLGQPSKRINPQWYFEGSPTVLSLLREKPNFANAIYAGPAPAARQDAPLLSGTSVPPLPGRRFASPFVVGPYVVGFDMATYTLQLQDGSWVGTGHGIEDAGSVSWPITSVSVDSLDTKTDSVNAHLIGGIFGTLEYDGEKGSLIDATKAAATMPVTVNSKVNGTVEAPVEHQVRFDLGSSTENQGIEVAAQATIDAQGQNAGSTLNVTGTIKMTVGGTTVTKTLSFPSNESLSALETTLGNDIDNILVAQNNAAPTQQIQAVTITLGISG